MPNSHVATSYVAEVNNPRFDIWRPILPLLDKEWSKCTLCHIVYADTRGTKVLYIYNLF